MQRQLQLRQQVPPSMEQSEGSPKTHLKPSQPALLEKPCRYLQNHPSFHHQARKNRHAQPTSPLLLARVNQVQVSRARTEACRVMTMQHLQVEMTMGRARKGVHPKRPYRRSTYVMHLLIGCWQTGYHTTRRTHSSARLTTRMPSWKILRIGSHGVMC
ncbi:hypothetical protein CLOM_g23394 [Closterium sp. NIES-68]|nr:hypothetical protein CLOM_g23394 [Closterium sp. NIES-68]GJP72966.1 hypothetical protein CLOP_g3733 [Closterium sp. NIES-67]